MCFLVDLKQNAVFKTSLIARIQSVDAHRWFTLPTYCSPFCLHTSGPSSEIKIAHSGCEIKIMALKAQSSWSFQNQPYGPPGLVLFLQSVLSNMLEEMRVQPACLPADEPTKLRLRTGIHPGCSHSNKLSLMCSA